MRRDRFEDTFSFARSARIDSGGGANLRKSRARTTIRARSARSTSIDSPAVRPAGSLGDWLVFPSKTSLKSIENKKLGKNERQKVKVRVKLIECERIETDTMAPKVPDEKLVQDRISEETVDTDATTFSPTSTLQSTAGGKL